MAVTLAIGDLLRVTHAAFLGNQMGQINICYRVSSVAGASVTDNQAATQIDNTVAASMKPLLATNASYYGTRLQRFSPGPSPLPAVASANVGVGTSPGTALPNQASGLIKAQTALAGPRYRGRVYVPFPYLSSTDTVLNVPTAGYKILLSTLGGDIYTPYVISAGLNSATLVPCIYHRATHTTTDIIASTPGNKWATQKRRGNYGRPNSYPPF
jgi:hypothetical protein